MTEYVTADHHFFHENIIKYCERPFYSCKFMDWKMTYNWNKVVNDDDVVYHLGDFALGTQNQIKNKLEELNGYKILIRGNHDKGEETMKKLGFDEVYSGNIKHNGNILCHKPFDTSYNPFNVSVEIWQYYPIPMPQVEGWLIHGHIHNNEYL